MTTLPKPYPLAALVDLRGCRGRDSRAWSLEPGAWSLEPGAWSLTPHG